MIKTKTTLHVRHKKLLADTLTPVSIYLQLRDRYPNALLLESSDYHGQENSLSMVCCIPFAHFKVSKGSIDSNPVLEEDPGSVAAALQQFLDSFEIEESGHPLQPAGLFGYTSYDAIRHFEDLDYKTRDEEAIPEVFYQAYRMTIVIDHFRNEAHIFELSAGDDHSRIGEIEEVMARRNLPHYPFSAEEEESHSINAHDFKKLVEKGIMHCQRGDVFQVVFSRQFRKKFSGDEFNLYRALRSVNPSPYLFYFDFGQFRIFGSSPEAHLIVQHGIATINPIAGTFKRTGDDEADAALARELMEDQKENAEHVMLVDLARNDLSKHGDQVKVEVFKEVQYYSHVIHLVSRVTGKTSRTTPEMMAATFPAGTLSGAPKYRALQLINEYEPVDRQFYGGAIGFLGFNGDFNHAIMIRSFMSKHGELIYQAGAGIVADSDPEKELNEVDNKLGALRRAIKLAEEI